MREGNVTCQNGYIHIMEGVPEPLPNMAGYLRTNGNTSLFSKLMDRYSAPFVSVLLTNSYKDLHDLYAKPESLSGIGREGTPYMDGVIFSLRPMGIH